MWATKYQSNEKNIEEAKRQKKTNKKNDKRNQN